jgi:hypothetical protein
MTSGLRGHAQIRRAKDLEALRLKAIPAFVVEAKTKSNSEL